MSTPVGRIKVGGRAYEVRAEPVKLGAPGRHVLALYTLQGELTAIVHVNTSPPVLAGQPASWRPAKRAKAAADAISVYSMEG